MSKPTQPPFKFKALNAFAEASMPDEFPVGYATHVSRFIWERMIQSGVFYDTPAEALIAFLETEIAKEEAKS